MTQTNRPRYSRREWITTCDYIDLDTGEHCGKEFVTKRLNAFNIGSCCKRKRHNDTNNASRLRRVGHHRRPKRKPGHTSLERVTVCPQCGATCEPDKNCACQMTPRRFIAPDVPMWKPWK